MAIALPRNGPSAPLADMNTTPLIDVMLVLLVMLIFTIPMATHSLDVDLPQTEPPPKPFEVDPQVNKIVLTGDGRILWNGDAVDRGQLAGALAATAAIRPRPELQYEPEAQASYDLSAKVLRIIKASNVPNFGFVGNERYREFAAAPRP